MKFCVLLMLCIGLTQAISAQGDKNFFALPLKKQQAFVRSVNKKFTSVDRKILVSTTSSLNKLKKQEQKLYKQLYKKDSVAAKAFLLQSQARYAALETKLRSGESKELKEYIPAFDTLKSSLSFLDSNITKGHPLAGELGDASAAVKQFESRMQIANEIKRQLRDRKTALAKQFEQFGMVKEMKQLNKEVFYYNEQLKEYKALLKDHKKIEKKALALLRESKPFKEFMKQNSVLAQMFKLPPGQGSGTGNLQTRAMLESILAQRIAGGGTNVNEQMQQQVNQAQAELSKIKAKANSLKKSNSGDIEMPGNFKQNNQKTKSFFNRLEYGANIQTQKLNSYLPTTTDLALSVGYKLNDKTVMGIGASYKLGLGKDWSSIKLTSQGGSVRSFVDIKAKRAIWLSGGYERNYLSGIGSIQQLNNNSNWVQSALIGLTKKISMKNNRSGKVQLLYDVLYNRKEISKQPVVFRVGYTL